MSSSSASSSGCGTTDEEELDQENGHLPLSAGSLHLSHLEMELPDLTTRMIHESGNRDSMDRHFPVVPETMMTNAAGKRTGHRHSLHKKTDKMLKEINSLKRQNAITHYLLGTVIVLTLGWQLSEVSIILALKDGFTHPFRSIGNFLSRMVESRRSSDSVDASKEESSALPSLVPIEQPPMLGIRVPVLPKILDISKWGKNGNGP